MTKTMGKTELAMRWRLVLGMVNLLPVYNLNWADDEKKTWRDCLINIIRTELELAKIEDESRRQGLLD